MDLDALETSFDLVAPKGDELVEIFYARLFETAPSVKPLFASADMTHQRTMLLSALVLLRKSLRDVDSIVPALKRMGARHVGYGAAPAHYPVVGEVLIGSMAEIAGPAWEPRFERAWGEAFAVVAGAMLEGAAEAEFAIAA
jgi:methyl-accepting chemotaxis protein